MKNPSSPKIDWLMLGKESLFTVRIKRNLCKYSYFSNHEAKMRKITEKDMKEFR
jgi:hypothetical protein